MDGVIAGVGAAVTRDQLPHEARVVDCKGDVVAPGLKSTSISSRRSSL